MFHRRTALSKAPLSKGHRFNYQGGPVQGDVQGSRGLCSRMLFKEARDLAILITTTPCRGVESVLAILLVFIVFSYFGLLPMSYCQRITYWMFCSTFGEAQNLKSHVGKNKKIRMQPHSRMTSPAWSAAGAQVKLIKSSLEKGMSNCSRKATV